MKKYIIAVFIIFIIGLAAYVSFGSEKETNSNYKISVVTSFYPLYFFASEIGGKHIEVQNITPSGFEPHDYEPTPQDMIAIEKSDVLVLNGADLEPWGKNVLANLGSKKLVVIAGENLATLTIDDENGGGKVTDPHVWLSPSLAVKMVERIRDGIIEADPKNESDYRANSNTLIAKLTDLDSEFKTGLQSCSSRDIITSHAAFAYIARDYNLRQVSISGLLPEEEPSAQDLVGIVKFARQNNVKYIFFETLSPADFSETIAHEIGAQTLVLNPIEGMTDEELSEGKNYVTEMTQNLNNLKIALQCQ